MPKFSSCVVALLLPFTINNLSIAATTSVPTETVKGREPKASVVVIVNRTNPEAGVRVGHTLLASFSSVDEDGDVVDRSSFRWLRAGSPISGATSSTYITQSIDANNILTLEVTPNTHPETTDPSSGMPVRSSGVTVSNSAVSIGKFFAPDTRTRIWLDADAHCRRSGGRLPNQSELQELFLRATSATSPSQRNTEMCSIYGWPLSSKCGGGVYNYWSSTPFSIGGHYAVSLLDGLAVNGAGSSLYQVACVRPGN
ncbi:hypothetical protein [Pseudomonas peli]|uniref:hypothetical protein n=1 Tax=Pseudomonas peli TaxID=592361 RepID=UPI0024ACCF20|nr:hypothetical protein [Pseudomonas peli]